MHSRFSAALVRSVAALGLGGAVAAADPGVPASPEANPPGPVMAHGLGGSPASQPALPTVTPTAPDMKAVQDLLARLVGDVTAGGKSADLASLMARGARDPMAAAPTVAPDLDRAAAAFRAAWQTRFGTSFDIGNKVPVVMTEPNVHVTDVQPPPSPTPSTQETATRKTAVTVVLTGPGGRDAVALHLLNEGTGGKTEWHVDVPATATAATLNAALAEHLTAVTAAQASWPTDVDQAYEYVTQRLLSAVGSPAEPH